MKAMLIKLADWRNDLISYFEGLENHDADDDREVLFIILLFVGLVLFTMVFLTSMLMFNQSTGIVATSPQDYGLF